MPWITVIAKQSIQEENMENLGIDATESDYIWTQKSVRSEDISEFYKKTDKTLVLAFCDERPKLSVREDFDEFFKRIEDLDYGVEMEFTPEEQV